MAYPLNARPKGWTRRPLQKDSKVCEIEIDTVAPAVFSNTTPPPESTEAAPSEAASNLGKTVQTLKTIFWNMISWGFVSFRARIVISMSIVVLRCSDSSLLMLCPSTQVILSGTGLTPNFSRDKSLMSPLSPFKARNAMWLPFSNEMMMILIYSA